ncbi:Mbov_0399 family ICE element protein [Mycoplasmopsis columbinasalis]|uniref:Uncharacterized protein n=1 Tax=Mycoplasmopsis columbinasalis TaxID=114880 RepID=A0A449B9Q0_9BACT|nr:hypothetical protein [Mycoplasmopsis columbinasalis]VEU77896.1 Uncharacterised protein [Mycoplasmopsis columbinasalis]
MKKHKILKFIIKTSPFFTIPFLISANKLTWTIFTESSVFLGNEKMNELRKKLDDNIFIFDSFTGGDYFTELDNFPEYFQQHERTNSLLFNDKFNSLKSEFDTYDVKLKYSFTTGYKFNIYAEKTYSEKELRPEFAPYFTKDGFKIKEPPYNIFREYGHQLWQIKTWTREEILASHVPAAFNKNDKWEDYLKVKNYLNSAIVIESDTSGNLNTMSNETDKNYLKFLKLKNNIQKLEDQIAEINNKSKYFQLKFEIVDGSRINLYSKTKKGEIVERKESKSITFVKSQKSSRHASTKNLEINYGQYANFSDKGNINTVKETPKYNIAPHEEQTITDKDKHTYKLYDNGEIQVYSPLSVKFTAPNNNYVLYVNDIKVDVYDKVFFADLEEKDISKFGQNNKFVLEVKKYVDGSRNFPQDLESITRQTIIYTPKPFKVDMKWFGWNPDKKPEQKNLISRYIIDANGEVKRDGNGAALQNPNYDETIDPLTGTKKQLIWFKTHPYIDKGQTNSLNELVKNLNYVSYETSPNKNIQEKLYMQKTGLPYGTKFIFDNKDKNTTESEWAGVIAEATIIGKGGSFVYSGNTKELNIYKLKEWTPSDATSTYLSYQRNWINGNSRIVKRTNGTNEYIISSDDEFFSDNGIYLFVSKGEDTISSFKFVLIQKRDDEKNQNLTGSSFTDNIKSKQVQPLFESEIGKKFFAYLKNVLKVEYQLKTLSYEQCLVYFQKFLQYTEEQTKNNENDENTNENDRVWIRPLFNHNLDNLYSRNEFKAKYEGNLNTLAKDIFADFAHKDKIAIQNFTIDNYRKNNVILDLIVANPNLKYQLIANRVNFPIIFTDSNIGNEDEENVDTDPDIIYLEFDDEYIRTIEAPKYNVKSFIKTFDKKEPKRLWLKNLSRRSYEHINFENLTITKNDESQSVNITLKAELKPSAIALKKQLINRELHTTISYDLFGSGAIGIFADIDIFTINLIGVSQDQIEARIKWVLSQQMPRLVYERDYRIVPDTLERIKAILNEPEANIRDANARSEDLSLEEKETEANFGKTMGRITLPVINTIYDLSKVSFPPLDINAKYNVSALNTETLKTYLNMHILDTTGLNYFDINDIVYTNFNQLQNALMQASQQNVPANFNIEFQGRTNSKVKNSNRFAVQYHGHYDKTYTDLSEIDLKLTYAENDRAKLTNAIYNEIVKTLNEKGIETKAYIPISKGLIALLVNELTPDNAELPVTITKEFFIKPNEPFGQNQGKVTITNTLNQKPIDNNQFLIDLSIVNFDLTYDENVLSKLEAQIIADIKAKMTNAYQLNETQYAINRHKLHKLIREISDPNAKVKTKAFLIEPIENISENNGKVNITSTNTKPVNDDLPDIGEDPEEIAKKVFIKKVSYSVGGTVAFVTAFVLFVIWRKKRVRKIR